MGVEKIFQNERYIPFKGADLSVLQVNNVLSHAIGYKCIHNMYQGSGCISPFVYPITGKTFERYISMHIPVRKYDRARAPFTVRKAEWCVYLRLFPMRT